MENDDSRYSRNLGRNLIIGWAAVYPVTVGLCVAAGVDLWMSLGLAVFPAFFAGPFVGLVLTLIGAHVPDSDERTVVVPLSEPAVPAALAPVAPHAL